MTKFKTIRVNEQCYNYLKNMNKDSIAGNLTLLLEAIVMTPNSEEVIGKTLGNRFNMMRDAFGQIRAEKNGVVVSKDELDKLKSSNEKRRKKIIKLEKEVERLKKDRLSSQAKQSGLDEHTMQLIRYDYESYCDKCNEESRQPMTFDQWQAWMNE